MHTPLIYLLEDAPVGGGLGGWPYCGIRLGTAIVIIIIDRVCGNSLEERCKQKKRRIVKKMHIVN